jgi:hypothetical protein
LITTAITVIGNLIKPLVRARAHSIRVTSTVKAARALGWKNASPDDVKDVLNGLNQASSATRERNARTATLESTVRQTT